MIHVTTVSVMRERDAATIEGGVPGRELMWRAACGIYRAIPKEGRVGILCGSGNNAGDGYALALLLKEDHRDCTLLRLDERTSPDGAYYLEKCLQGGIPIELLEDEIDLSSYDILVDCILGTGFRGEVNGKSADVIRAINESGKFVISVDINSGLSGDSGEGDICVRSDLTVSIGTYKAGLFLGCAKDVIKEKCNVDIGISMPKPSIQVVEAEDFADVLRPRPATSHKGNYGYITVMGGCPSYSGAVKLANLSAAALRAGCGVAQLAVPASISQSVSPYLLESTLLSLPCDESGYMAYDAQILDTLLSRQAAIAVGMGWGRGRDNERILSHLLTRGSLPLLIDADGLNTLAEMDKSLLKRTKCRVVLTPHLKEFERLSGIPVSEIQRDPIGHACAFAGEYGVVLLLKGACTVVTDGEETLLVDRGCPGMATAGSGDVLSGILAGLLGYAPVTTLTVACGAYIAGLAGELAQKVTGSISMIASDTVSHIPEAVMQMTKACF